ncbi:MAG: mannose-6-phosphate isomerase [Betaproteobacteria bacterium]|nr:MAG: mannose-6-phosphate isomerase [Betaproteobacteria bacterium]
MTGVVNLAQKFAQFDDHWNPRLAGELNGQHVRLVKFQGAFPWHRHEHEDEMFLVVAGEFDMRFRDRTERVRAGEFIIVPRGTEHCPYAEREVHVLLFEPAGTVNTGNVIEARTRGAPERI